MYLIVCQQLIMMVHKDNCDGRPFWKFDPFAGRHSAQKATLRACNYWNQQSILMMNLPHIDTL